MNRYFTKYRLPSIIFLIFIFFALAIIILHLNFHSIRVLGMDTSIFYMDEKYTLASYFSTIITFLIGYIAITNAINNFQSIKKRVIDIGFGLFFLILSVDEFFEVHEYTNTLIKEGLRGEATLFALANWSWIFSLSLIIIGVFILLILKIKWSNNYIRLPLIAGLGCFGLVLVFEILGASTYGQNIYLYYVALEEGLEMIGESIFLFTVLIEGSAQSLITNKK